MAFAPRSHRSIRHMGGLILVAIPAHEKKLWLRVGWGEGRFDLHMHGRTCLVHSSDELMTRIHGEGEDCIVFSLDFIGGFDR